MTVSEDEGPILISDEGHSSASSPSTWEGLSSEGRENSSSTIGPQLCIPTATSRTATPRQHSATQAPQPQMPTQQDYQ